jgi:hypothetical protein
MFARTTSLHVSEIEFMYGQPEGHDFLLEVENNAMSTVPGSSMWTALDDILSAFSGLRTIRFTLSPHQSDLLSFVGYMKRGLSACKARGLLSFEHVLDGISNLILKLGACCSPPFFTEPPPAYLSLPSRYGMVSGPLCIAQLLEPTV